MHGHVRAAELNENFMRLTSATKTHREENFSTYCD